MTDLANSPAAHRRSLRIAVIGLLVLTFAVFGRCVTFDFLNWDDLTLVVQNKLLNPVTVAHVATAWMQPVEKLYSPLAYTAWSAVALVSKLPTPDQFGSQLNPMVFHTLNVLLHAGCVLMVFAILRQLFGQIAPAFFGAAVFAVHPIQVEPVSWISGMNNLLAGFFVLIAIWAYIRFATGNRPVLWYTLTVLALTAGLGSKPTAIVAPLMLLAIDLLILRRPMGKSLLSVLPMFIVTIPFVILGRKAQVADVITPPPFGDRLRIVADTFGYYFGKIVWPHPLLFDYSRTPEWVISHGVAAGSVVALVVVGAILAISLLLRQQRIIAAVAIFAAGVLPVCGITPFAYQYYSTVSDRYTYLSMLGVAVLVAAIIRAIPKPATLATAATILAILAGVSFDQTGVWADTASLANHTLAYNPRSFTSHDLLADLARRTQDWALAEDHLHQALAIAPDEPGCNFNLGSMLLLNENRPADAIPYLKRATDWGIDDADCHYDLGLAYMKVGQAKLAIEPLNNALALNPGHVPSLSTLGYALASEGKLDEAEKKFRQAIALDPNYPLAKMGLEKVTAARAEPIK